MTPDNDDDAAAEGTPEGTGGRRRCPICGRPSELRWRPFCSRRCGDVDLGRWISGRYAVPVVEPDEGDEEGLDRLASGDAADDIDRDG